MTTAHVFLLIFVWFLIALSVYRITRFITRDDFPPIKWFREHMAYDDETNPQTHNKRFKWVPYWLAELLSCPWCVSAYISAIVVWLTDITLDRGLPVPVLFAIAAWATATWPLLWEDSKN